MRHRKDSTKLGRSSAHRKATVGALVCELIERKRIRTTLSKAKAARPLAEKMVTLAKRGTLAARRQALSRLQRRTAVSGLWDIAPSFAERQGGYTRIVKLGRRRSDGSEMAVLEWVDTPPPAPKKKKEKPERNA